MLFDVEEEVLTKVLLSALSDKHHATDVTTFFFVSI
jgi:hypothetical protein